MTKSGKHLLPYRFKTEGQTMLIKDLSSTILCLCLLANAGPDAFVSGRRRVRVWDEARPRLGYETDEPGTAFADKLGCWICDLCFLGAGRVFKIQKNLCAVLSQIISGKAYTHDKRTKREKGRPERVISSKPRATPWVSAHKRLRPVRAKVWANGWLLLLPLQGVGNGDMVPRVLPWAPNLLGFQPAQGRPYVPNLWRQRP